MTKIAGILTFLIVIMFFLSLHTEAHYPIRNHVLHMDCYDVFWDGEAPTPNHPIEGVATNPHYDPQRKSLGDILRFADKVDLVNMIPTNDSTVCSTTFCLANSGKEYLAYQPEINESIKLNLKSGKYSIETFDTIDSSIENSSIEWDGGQKVFAKPSHVAEDWVIIAKLLE